MNTRALVILAVIMASTLACAPGRPRARGVTNQQGNKAGGMMGGAGGMMAAMCDPAMDYSAMCAAAQVPCTKADITATSVTCKTGAVGVYTAMDVRSVNGAANMAMECKVGKWMLTQGTTEVEVMKPYNVACYTP